MAQAVPRPRHQGIRGYQYGKWKNVDVHYGEYCRKREHYHGVGYESPLDTFPPRWTGLNSVVIRL